MLPLLVITYVIYEQLDRMESLKIKNEMYKMWTAAVLPDSAMQDNIIRDYVQKMAPHSTTKVKLPKIRKDYICDLSKIHTQRKMGGFEERIFYIYKYPFHYCAIYYSNEV